MKYGKKIIMDRKCPVWLTNIDIKINRRVWFDNTFIQLPEDHEIYGNSAYVIWKPKCNNHIPPFWDCVTMLCAKHKKRAICKTAINSPVYWFEDNYYTVPRQAVYGDIKFAEDVAEEYSAVKKQNSSKFVFDENSKHMYGVLADQDTTFDIDVWLRQTLDNIDKITQAGHSVKFANAWVDKLWNAYVNRLKKGQEI